MRFLDKIFHRRRDPSDWDQFYQRFEDRFRGSEDLISKRLSQRYRKRMQDVSASFECRSLLDLGCGRGEFLQLGKLLGFETFGVDQSSSAVRRCCERGHKVVVSDMLEFLRKQKSNSFGIVSAFHVVEHCPADYFWKVYSEVYRILVKKGVFIVETPSLYSLWSSARQFFLDPTHIRPVHPEFLSFTAEDCGFSSYKIMEFDKAEGVDIVSLKETISKDIYKSIEPLEKWLYGPMDLALWAQK